MNTQGADKMLRSLDSAVVFMFMEIANMPASLDLGALEAERREILSQVTR